MILVTLARMAGTYKGFALVTRKSSISLESSTGTICLNLRESVTQEKVWRRNKSHRKSTSAPPQNHRNLFFRETKVTRKILACDVWNLRISTATRSSRLYFPAGWAPLHFGLHFGNHSMDVFKVNGLVNVVYTLACRIPNVPPWDVFFWGYVKDCVFRIPAHWRAKTKRQHYELRQ